jgi:hypothetical protein
VLTQGGWTGLEGITKATIVGRTGIAANWEILYEAGPKKFHFEVTKGALALVKVENPDIPAALPVTAAQPWGRYAGKELFARDFRLEPYGLVAGGVSPAYTAAGAQLSCAGAACTPFAAATLPSGKGADVVVEAEFAKAGGPDEARYGIILRGGAAESLVFTVSGNGRYSVMSVQAGGQMTTLGQGTLTGFATGNGTNTLVAIVYGGTGRFVVNGAEVWLGQVTANVAGDAALLTTSADLKVAVHYARVFEAKRP